MNSYYFDTSAILKRYINEPGSNKVNNLFNSAKVAFTSILTYAEVYSSINRQYIENNISSRDQKLILSSFEADWKFFAVIELRDNILGGIPLLLKKCYLRGADLVHLASIHMLIKAGMEVILVVSDHKLLNGAIAAGIEALDPMSKL